MFAEEDFLNIFMLKLDGTLVYKISFFFSSSDLGFEIKKFFLQFWLIFCPLDPPPNPGGQNVADHTDPDPKHGPKYFRRRDSSWGGGRCRAPSGKI